MEVEVREEASSGRSSRYPTTLLSNNTPDYPVADAPVVVVRVEEVLLVALVLVIWVAAIALFFNRWGKIRMLEPYQPKFHQQPHRPSCPLAPLSPPVMSNQARMSFSKYNVNALTDPLSVLPSPIIRRPRQNSVFVGSSTVAMLNPPPRRVKSAIDIQHLVVNEHSPTASLKGNRKGSIIPILNKDRRPSLITIERPYYARHHRPSINIERPFVHQPRSRRQSCFAERSLGRHRNFISFEHAAERRAQPSCSFHPTISFETPMESLEPGVRSPSPPPPPPPPICTGAIPKASRSFEHDMNRDRPKAEWSSHSLDVSAISFDRRSSIVEEDRGSPVFVNLDDVKITAPLLEGLKSSDV
ncbi:unnamed protein product [Phyllotreta striolata]|uniref:Fibronectin type III domain-containing protein n=1 Tax=Phyllotreta striolata TaxID=444603 RepID=A0A9P0DSX2_PHYSR|nr:unnamed protein product [Phyllotreta striolata]